VIHKNHSANVVDVGGVDATWFDPALGFTPWAATVSASPSQPAVGWAWGASGNLGDGSTPNRSTPGEVSALTQLVAVAAGGHSLALASDGSVWAWGNNSNGQLGDGTTTTRFAPTQVVGLGGVTAISAGWAHSLALTKDGTVWAWGWNQFGQLGTGKTDDNHNPVQVSGLTGVVAVAAGKEQSFALKADGTVSAWGNNEYGYLGNGTPSAPQLRPVTVSGLSGVVAIAAGHVHTLALKSDGTVSAWGLGWWGNLGNGTTAIAPAPVAVSGLSRVVAIAAGGAHSLALKNDGSVSAWGANDATPLGVTGGGQLGLGDTTMRTTPVTVNQLSGVVGIAAGGVHSLALTGDGTVWAWGSSGFGQVGNGSTTTQLMPVALSGMTPAVALAAGIFHSLALTTAPAQVSTATVYDFNTGLPVSTTDANGQTAQAQYAAGSLRPTSVVLPTGATVSYAYDDAALSMTTTVCTAACGAGASIAAQHVARVNGKGLTRSDENLADGGQWNIIRTQYDALGRRWQQTQPFRSGDTPIWDQLTYDALGRITLATSADGSQTSHFYNESTLPSTVTVPGRTERVVDAWGQERLLLRNALGQLSLVVDPNPASGLVKDPGATQTTYSYNTRNQLTAVARGAQNRTLVYDGLGQLTHQALSEKSLTLNDLGASWSDVLTYDDRSRLTSRTDARGVTTRYDYANDPLDRLHTVTYDTAGVSDTSNPIIPAAGISYQYMPAGDMTRPVRVTATGVSTTVSAYDAQGRLQSQALTLTSRPDYPEITGYGYDPLSRRTDLSYPAAYGMPVVWGYEWPAPGSHLVHVGYGVADQPNGLTVDGIPYASQMAYGAGGQLKSLTVGWVQISPIAEIYNYDPATGRLHDQQLQRAGAPLLDLIYNELRPGTSSGRTGRVTQVTDSLDGLNSQSYIYDALGRVTQAVGGNSPTPLWTQQYIYDQYGNRTGVTAAGTTESGAPVPPDGLATPSDPATNHITTSGFTYDAAGNLTRGQRVDGTWQRYQYDAAGRLVNVLSDGGAILEAATYGPDRRRLVSQTGGPSPQRTYYVWDGEKVISQYRETAAAPTAPQWVNLYVYLGSRLLSTWTANGTSAAVQFDHPDRLGTRLITDAADATVRKQTVLPYGVAFNGESTSTNNPVFTSYDRSAATGLDYAVNRHYHPQLGRFMQVDPLETASVSQPSPQRLNLYTYVQNDPINSADPLGLATNESWLECYYVGEESKCEQVDPTAETILVNQGPGSQDQPPPESVTGGVGLLPGSGPGAVLGRAIVQLSLGAKVGGKPPGPPKPGQPGYIPEVNPGGENPQDLTQRPKPRPSDPLDRFETGRNTAKTAAEITFGVILLYGTYQAGNWALAIILAPETGGVSLIVAGATSSVGF